MNHLQTAREALERKSFERQWNVWRKEGFVVGRKSEAWKVWRAALRKVPDVGPLVEALEKIGHLSEHWGDIAQAALSAYRGGK